MDQRITPATAFRSASTTPNETRGMKPMVVADTTALRSAPGWRIHQTMGNLSNNIEVLTIKHGDLIKQPGGMIGISRVIFHDIPCVKSYHLVV